MKWLCTTLLSVTLFHFHFNGSVQDDHEVSGKILHRSSGVNINGSDFFYYEVEIANKSNEPIVISSANVKTQNGENIFSASKEQLQKLSNTNSNVLMVSDTAIFYLDIPYKQLRNRAPLDIVLTYTGKQRKEFAITIKTSLLTNKPVVLSAPLKGKNWMAIYSSEWQRGHRRVYYMVGGQSRIPGRFAIDFVRLDGDGKLYLGNSDSTANYYSYNQDILAVADGIIVSLRNDFKEMETMAGHTVHIAKDASGNYIALQIGKDLYAFYEHLKPRSILFNVGDKVKKGSVIAKVGFTGDASEPHLHFHVADKNSLLGAEGLPFLFNEFSYEGTYDDFSNFGKQRWEAFSKAQIKNVLPSRPLPNSVISFPN